jgi:Uma2 family endonuclease
MDTKNRPLIVAWMNERMAEEPMTNMRLTSRDLESLPDDNKRYELIDGELYVSKQPHYNHQVVCGRIWEVLQVWSRQTQAGAANLAPGVIFAEDEDVAPDVVWNSRTRLALTLQADGKLHTAPDLAVEVLSPGTANEQRDRALKLKLYSRRGVQEYWIVNWQQRSLELYRRQDGVLTLDCTLYEADLLQSPLLPGFSCQVSELFIDVL